MCILDFGKMPLVSSMVDMIKAAADIAHQSPRNCALVKYPARVRGNAMTTYLNHIRKMEDNLLGQGLSIEDSLHVMFETAHLHGNDNREALSRIRIAYSNNFPECTWTSSHALNDDRCFLAFMCC